MADDRALGEEDHILGDVGAQIGDALELAGDGEDVDRDAGVFDVLGDLLLLTYTEVNASETSQTIYRSSNGTHWARPVRRRPSCDCRS